MNDKELKQYLKQCLQQETELDKLHNKEDVKKLGNAGFEETVRLCTEIMREQKLTKKSQEEPRIGFARYLSDIFRFEGVAIFWFASHYVIHYVCGNLHSGRKSKLYSCIYAAVCIGYLAGYVQMSILWNE